MATASYLVEPIHITELMLSDIHAQLGCIGVHYFWIALDWNVTLCHAGKESGVRAKRSSKVLADADDSLADLLSSNQVPGTSVSQLEMPPDQLGPWPAPRFRRCRSQASDTPAVHAERFGGLQRGVHARLLPAHLWAQVSSQRW